MNEKYEMLERAIRTFQGEDILCHLIDHLDINSYAQGRTLLHQAVEMDNVQATAVLISKGALVDCENARGETPLHLAKSLETANLLVERGASVKRRRYDGATPLHTCHSPRIAKYLIDRGADVHAQTLSGETPLHMSKECGITSCLVDNGGADVNMLNRNQYTALHLACSFGRWRIVIELLQRGASMSNLDQCQRTPLNVAKAVLQVFTKEPQKLVDVFETRELMRTIQTLHLWSQFQERGLTTQEIKQALSWYSFRQICRSPNVALANSTILPLEILDCIVIEYLGPWSIHDH